MTDPCEGGRHCETIAQEGWRVVDEGSIDEALGVHKRHVVEWLRANVGTLSGPVSFTPLVGGRSNLTFRVSDGSGTSLVLRRPPLHGVLPSAHDMQREYRILAALTAAGFPVPRVFAYCDDRRVTGAEFYVMEYMDGIIVQSSRDARRLGREARRAAGRAIAETLAGLHTLDPSDIGLGELGPRRNYFERQLRRWSKQLAGAQIGPDPILREAEEALWSAVPPSQSAGLVHGDYRLNNIVISDAGAVRAVLDWELCTLGDALADLGFLLIHWGSDGDSDRWIDDLPTYVGGFPTRDEVLSTYERSIGSRVPNVEYYIAFALWKLAAIMHGVYARNLGGAYGSVPSVISSYPSRIRRLATSALKVLNEGWA